MAAVPALSHSSVQTYSECPLRWKFLYIDRLPEAPRGYFSFGRTVHSVLEELLRPFVVPSGRLTEEGERQRTLDEWAHGRPSAPRLLSPAEVLATYERLWVSDGYVSREEENRYRSLGADLLLRYRNTLADAQPVPIGVEMHLETRWDGIPIHGYIDRIDRTAAGGLEIVDYKTSRELSAEDALGSEQLALYQVLVERNFPDPVQSLTLYHLRSLTPLRSPPRDRPALDRLKKRVGAVSDGIRSQAYDPTPGRHCSRCEFKVRCPEFREVPRADRERLATLVDRFAELRAQEDRLGEELKRTAEALHREAEQLGVHRIAGGASTAFRRREESWSYAPEAVETVLTAGGLNGSVDPKDPDQVRRLLRDTRVDEGVRLKLERTGGRAVRWYWVLEETTGRGESRRSE
ncbi:MAG TPA: PD-(D/E)XK nuclease family protein [Thermoplasmata archaeon]|nr:PD-(D/E)XK nuclease family protein [Thermoplasmata archaeon]